MCSRESVICMVFSLQKYRPRANKKKVFMPQKSPTSEIRTLVHQAKLRAADLLLPQILSWKIAWPIRNDQQTFLQLWFCFQDSMRPGSRGFFETGRVYEIFGPAGKTDGLFLTGRRVQTHQAFWHNSRIISNRISTSVLFSYTLNLQDEMKGGNPYLSFSSSLVREHKILKLNLNSWQSCLSFSDFSLELPSNETP